MVEHDHVNAAQNCDGNPDPGEVEHGEGRDARLLQRRVGENVGVRADQRTGSAQGGGVDYK